MLYRGPEFCYNYRIDYLINYTIGFIIIILPHNHRKVNCYWGGNNCVVKGRHPSTLILCWSFLSLSLPSSYSLQSRKSRTRDRTLSSSGEQTSLSSSSGRPDSADHNSSSSGGGASSASAITGGGGGGAGSGGGASKSSKKKKKKMQKVNPAAMLGFTVNAAERPNMGEIQSVHDTQ